MAFSFNISHAKNLTSITYNIFIVVLMWAATWQNQQCGCAPSEDSDQPGHPPSLIRVFAVRLKKPWVLSYPFSTQRRLWSDWADAKADLSLRWAHSHFVGFVMSRLNCNAMFSVCTRVIKNKNRATSDVIGQFYGWFFVCVFPTLRLLQTFHTRGALKLMIQQWISSPIRNNVSIPLCMLYPPQEAESKYV